MLLTTLFISVNTPKVQDFIKQSFIDYLNIGINNNLIIENSSFNINGEVVFNDIYLSSKDSDTLLYLEELKMSFLSTKVPPQCSSCYGLIKTATISFGQPMPEKEMVVAQKKSINCDLFICIGTSLAVFPAADLPVLAKETGSKLVIINNEPTQMDHIADLVINRDISEVFSEISI